MFGRFSQVPLFRDVVQPSRSFEIIVYADDQIPHRSEMTRYANSGSPDSRAGEAYLSVGEKVRTISYMPGSNFAIVSASSRKGSGPGSRRMDS
jgi:hypothetical protein